MILLSLFFTILFLLITFSKATIPLASTNPFLAYLSYNLQIIQKSGGFFLLLYLLVSAISLFFIRFEKHYSFFKKYTYSLLHTGISFFLGGFVAFFLACFVAFLQLTVMSVLLRINPNILGVTRDQQQIMNALQHVKELPEIIATESDSRVELQALARATAGRDTFYSKYILSSLPSFLILPMPKTNSSMQLLDNTLIISQIKPDSIEQTSPIIGYLLVKNYFRNREIKRYPDVFLMDRSEYLDRRTADSNKKIDSLTEEIISIEHSIASQSAGLSLEKEQLATQSAQLADVKKQRSTSYSKCLADGILQGTTFVRIHTKDFCEQLVQPIDTNIALLQKDADILAQKIDKDGSSLKTSQAYELFFKQQQLILQKSKANFTHELGVFDPQKSIKIALDTTSSHTIADYLETLSHEYLHYASYQSEKKKLSELFFEEGLTEYFARQTVTEGLNISTNLGYPLYVKIISQMTQLIPESELADIYFSKDQEQLEKTLDRVYGDGFYQKNRLVFLGIQYASSKEQLLALSNQIMKQIGGPTLTAKDLVSNYSNF